ncbi:MAG: hypothetical protein LBM13_04995 [Candidatus Ancillula sp.]|jgi:hypothetical protein|nr:hypothetical protein [Candidatus Ancillula sp.]
MSENYNDMISRWEKNPVEIDESKITISPLGYLYKILKPLGFDDKDIYYVFNLSKKSALSLPEFIKQSFEHEIKLSQTV